MNPAAARIRSTSNTCATTWRRSAGTSSLRPRRCPRRWPAAPAKSTWKPSAASPGGSWRSDAAGARERSAANVEERLTALDWLILLIVGASVLLALSQGFLVEMFSLGGAVLGLVGASWGYPVLTPFFQAFVKLTALAQLFSFLTIFFVLFLAMGITGRMLSRAAKETGMRWADRAIGAAFGLVRGLIVAAVLVLAFATFYPEGRMISNSTFGRP